MKRILLAGAGPMAVEYTKVLKELGITPFVVGRSQKSADVFREKTGIEVYTKPILELAKEGEKFDAAINAVTEDQLGLATLDLIKLGVPEILVEKPGAIDAEELLKVQDAAKKSSVYIGYNRRFFSSVLAARKLIAEDGGVTSFTFDFTERNHLMVNDVKKSKKVKEEWFLHNPTHVVDLAFFMGGMPAKMSCYTQGSLSWHPAAGRFVGAGLTEADIPFAYHSNWDSPGRWSLEVLTKNHKMFFKPVEKLQVQVLANFEVKDYPIDDALDKKFKPGLYLQVSAFLGDKKDLLPLDEQVAMLPVFGKILHGT